jgi:hypothetical protein
MDEQDQRPTKQSSPLLVAGAWLVVIVPAIWGLSYTVKNAVKIFTHEDPSAVSATVSGAAAPSAAPSK